MLKAIFIQGNLKNIKRFLNKNSIPYTKYKDGKGQKEVRVETHLDQYSVLSFYGNIEQYDYIIFWE
jgi:hypothetical protein